MGSLQILQWTIGNGSFLTGTNLGRDSLGRFRVVVLDFIFSAEANESLPDVSVSCGRLIVISCVGGSDRPSSAIIHAVARVPNNQTLADSDFKATHAPSLSLTKVPLIIFPVLRLITS